MAKAFRLATGGRIDRGQPLIFTFNGKPLKGCKGDTLASALLANDCHLVARSLKYHRPRGIVAASVEEPNALVQVGTGALTTPNLKATEIDLFDGLTATSVNCWPSVDFDVNAINGWLSKLIPAGFYYKTFMPSQWLWMHVFEPFLRRAGGLGKAPTVPDPDCYDHKHVHCDVLVVGAGAAGIAAARHAAAGGARVILADEQSEFGGRLLSQHRTIDELPASDWLERERAALTKQADVRLLPRTTVFGYYQQNYLCALERRAGYLLNHSSPAAPSLRLWHIRAKQVILATGAHERPLVFADNDRPGIMLSSAAQTYVNRYGVAPGKTPVLFTNNDGAYEAAFDLAQAGLNVAAIIDLRPTVPVTLSERARALGIAVLIRTAVTAVHGRKRITSVEVSSHNGDGQVLDGPARVIDCDLLLMSGGWSPAVHLFCQSQGKLRFDTTAQCFVPETTRENTLWAGSVGGTFDLAGCLSEGASAGQRAAHSASYPAINDLPVTQAVSPDDATGVAAYWRVPSTKQSAPNTSSHFVDFQNDTTLADIQLAAREGFDNVEHMKRYTLSGFGTDQGKTGNINALANLAETIGISVPQTGTTTFRPPYTPVQFGAMGGREREEWLEPVRITALHDRHVANGAVFENVGQWKRPYYFPKAGEDMDAAVRRECLAVRTAVGLLDASTLGKIDLQGPDVATFLNRIYTNKWDTLKIDSIRYGVMCHEDGMIFDDGTTARLGEEHFLMTTTSGGAGRVLDWLEEYLQTEWPDLEVHCTSVTEQWANVTLAGPKAREVLSSVCADIDFDTEAFPHMTLRRGTIEGIPAQISRISFSGELSYEINIAWAHAPAVWDALMRSGQAHGITPYGTEAMHVLRAEKGFAIVGQETDGTVTPQDLGMNWLISKTKSDFLGKRSFTRPDTARSDRKQLVGLLTDEPDTILPEGAQLVADPNAPVPVPMLGHVTSSYWSPTLGRAIALALVKSGRMRMGETLYAPLETATHAVKIAEPVFYDPKNERRNG